MYTLVRKLFHFGQKVRSTTEPPQCSTLSTTFICHPDVLPDVKMVLVVVSGAYSRFPLCPCVTPFSTLDGRSQRNPSSLHPHADMFQVKYEKERLWNDLRKSFGIDLYIINSRVSEVALQLDSRTLATAYR